MDLRRSHHHLGIAAHEPERLLPFGQKFDEFIADGAARSEYGDHLPILFGDWKISGG
jgi:hypothetical protein